MLIDAYKRFVSNQLTSSIYFIRWSSDFSYPIRHLSNIDSSKVSYCLPSSVFSEHLQCIPNRLIKEKNAKYNFSSSTSRTPDRIFCPVSNAIKRVFSFRGLAQPPRRVLGLSITSLVSLFCTMSETQLSSKFLNYLHDNCSFWWQVAHRMHCILIHIVREHNCIFGFSVSRWLRDF
jgi:hypothetical protein